MTKSGNNRFMLNWVLKCFVVNFYVDIAHYGVEDIIIKTLGKD